MDKLISIKKTYDWNKRWDSKSRLFSYISPLIVEEYQPSLDDQRKKKINDRKTRYYP